MKKAWIGKTVIGIALVHIVFGLVFFNDILWQLVREGLFNTIHEEFDRNAAFWFLYTGLVWVLLGIFIDDAEKKQLAVPRTISQGLLVLTVLAVILMPASGFWLLFIPVGGLLTRK
ncbi:hypothetical protein HF324_05830 [Chitinophaga oryzae]|uniref:Uncharacterized protein n=1 Tax=Chitinophaga oryzae TaxID=2725414 RepID=A0AAE6ZDF4_9BACT|nr:DUF6463 family protein [Chitinophaga oryzae]QJB30906.1 hypothetical protein HF329_06165 [Chitinophaga oryzae]QJB37395.1 hypothetical protein HF324_05830 [Chitinophaga oryzae]